MGTPGASPEQHSEPAVDAENGKPQPSLASLKVRTAMRGKQPSKVVFDAVPFTPSQGVRTPSPRSAAAMAAQKANPLAPMIMLGPPPESPNTVLRNYSGHSGDSSSAGSDPGAHLPLSPMHSHQHHQAVQQYGGVYGAAPPGYHYMLIPMQPQHFPGESSSPHPHHYQYAHPHHYPPPSPLMGSPVSTPTAMMFPQTPFAQHSPYGPGNGGVGIGPPPPPPSQHPGGPQESMLSPTHSSPHPYGYYNLFNNAFPSFSPHMLHQPPSPRHGMPGSSPPYRYPSGEVLFHRSAYFPGRHISRAGSMVGPMSLSRTASSAAPPINGNGMMTLSRTVSAMNGGGNGTLSRAMSSATPPPSMVASSSRVSGSNVGPAQARTSTSTSCTPTPPLSPMPPASSAAAAAGSKVTAPGADSQGAAAAGTTAVATESSGVAAAAAPRAASAPAEVQAEANSTPAAEQNSSAATSATSEPALSTVEESDSPSQLPARSLKISVARMPDEPQASPPGQAGKSGSPNRIHSSHVHAAHHQQHPPHAGWHSPEHHTMLPSLPVPHQHLYGGGGGTADQTNALQYQFLQQQVQSQLQALSMGRQQQHSPPEQPHLLHPHHAQGSQQAAQLMLQQQQQQQQFLMLMQQQQQQQQMIGVGHAGSAGPQLGHAGMQMYMLPQGAGSGTLIPAGPNPSLPMLMAMPPHEYSAHYYAAARAQALGGTAGGVLQQQYSPVSVGAAAMHQRTAALVPPPPVGVSGGFRTHPSAMPRQGILPPGQQQTTAAGVHALTSMLAAAAAASAATGVPVLTTTAAAMNTAAIAQAQHTKVMRHMGDDSPMIAGSLRSPTSVTENGSIISGQIRLNARQRRTLRRAQERERNGTSAAGGDGGGGVMPGMDATLNRGEGVGALELNSAPRPLVSQLSLDCTPLTDAERAQIAAFAAGAADLSAAGLPAVLAGQDLCALIRQLSIDRRDEQLLLDLQAIHDMQAQLAEMADAAHTAIVC